MAPTLKLVKGGPGTNLSVQDKVLARTLIEDGYPTAEIAKVLKCCERSSTSNNREVETSHHVRNMSAIQCLGGPKLLLLALLQR